MKPKILMKIIKSFGNKIQKQVVNVLNLLFSFMVSFLKIKSHNMFAMMLDLYYKGLGLIIQFVGKRRTLQITSEHDH